MTQNELQNEIENELRKNDYYAHALEIDKKFNTTHAQLIEFLTKKRIMKNSETPTKIEIDGKRNVYGNYNDNNVLIEKTFAHLNSLKRSMSLSFQSSEHEQKLYHENNMFRELLNLELSLRTMKTNIKKQNENE